jgi:purine-cytosine permease-like protein
VYDSPSRLPLGIAGILAGCCGVAGAVVGMGQVYYTGPIAKKIGMFGADLGFEVSLPFLSFWSRFPPPLLGFRVQNR